MLRLIKVTVFLGTVVIFLPGCATYRTHPTFKERQREIQTVAVLPPEVEVVKITFKGDQELMYDLIGLVAKQSKEEIENVFREKGYDVHSLELSEEELNSTPDLKTDLFNLREIYVKTLEDISKRRQKKFTYSVGSDVNRFADLSQSEVLVLTKVDAFKKTKGEIAKDLAKSILIAVVTGIQVHSLHDAVSIRLAVVDGNTGDILWLNAMPGGGVDAAKEKELRKAVRSLLQPFPKRKGEEPLP